MSFLIYSRRSRLKNQMWYGVLGGKEMMQQTCKNLQKTIVLECDGRVIDLPRLQGIVVLNISSYMGGTNFVCMTSGGKSEKGWREEEEDEEGWGGGGKGLRGSEDWQEYGETCDCQGQC